MTRINLVPVTELKNRHLVAEYKEILRLPGYLQKSLRITKNIRSVIPKEFTLNTGHVKFFYDKGAFIQRRFNELREEMISRGFTPTIDSINNMHLFHDNGLFNDFHPSPRDVMLSRERIELRIREKPHLYRD